MKSRAPNVFRWTERMNLDGFFDGEFPDMDASYPRDDSIPETLEPLLTHIFKDWGPELLANADEYNAWVKGNPSLKPGDLVSAGGDRRLHPALGDISYALGRQNIRSAAAPQTLWHFDKALRRARALSGAARAQFDALVQRTGGGRAMAITLARPLKRENYVLVVG
jgi:hypothetical protein